MLGSGIDDIGTGRDSSKDGSSNDRRSKYN